MKNLIKLGLMASTLLLLLGFDVHATEKNDSQKSKTTPNQDFSQRLEQQRKSMDRLFNDFFDDEFFSDNRDPFKEMDKMRQKFKRFFDHSFSPSTSPFSSPDMAFDSFYDNWHEDRFGGMPGDIKRKEDDKFIYYEI